MWAANPGDMDEPMTAGTQDALPEAQYIRYDGLGHSMHWQDPERVRAT